MFAWRSLAIVSAARERDRLAIVSAARERDRLAIAFALATFACSRSKPAPTPAVEPAAVASAPAFVLPVIATASGASASGASASAATTEAGARTPSDPAPALATFGMHAPAFERGYARRPAADIALGTSRIEDGKRVYPVGMLWCEVRLEETPEGLIAAAAVTHSGKATGKWNCTRAEIAIIRALLPREDPYSLLATVAMEERAEGKKSSATKSAYVNRYNNQSGAGTFRIEAR